MTPRECVHLVTGRYFWLRNKDDGHAIRSAVAENLMLHALFAALCVIDAELLAMEFSRGVDPDLCWYADFCCEIYWNWMVVDFFAPVTLTLTR